jgi:hypothetical protein
MAGAANPPAARAENPPAAGAENPPAAGASGRIDGACRRGTPGVSGAARYKTNACENFFVTFVKSQHFLSNLRLNSKV